MNEKYFSNDRISKQKLIIFLIIDSSKSMAGKRINQVNQAVKDIQTYLIDLQKENTNVDFYLSIIPFGTTSYFYNNQTCINVDNLDYKGIKCIGYSNLHLAYDNLSSVMKKESKGGIMPDFGGAAPIVLLLTDGHPTSNKYKASLDTLKQIPWFKVALRYGIAIELNDERTKSVLHEFVGDQGEVINCYNSSMLKNIIKVIVLTASKVKSKSSSLSSSTLDSQNNQIVQSIGEALSELDNLEW